VRLAKGLEGQGRGQRAGISDLKPNRKQHYLHAGGTGVVAVNDGIDNRFGDHLDITPFDLIQIEFIGPAVLCRGILEQEDVKELSINGSPRRYARSPAPSSANSFWALLIKPRIGFIGTYCGRSEVSSFFQARCFFLLPAG
jgi:hypothetical protein